ncbi:hypothetical protein [Brevundimonas sp.]|uniref:hypothetical protein n=1 Tax=Brevundimonas sp. TaxID=1871086 RepID=UPI003A946270
MSEREPWWGLLHLRPLDASSNPLENGAAGAYAVVLALASNADGYREAVEVTMTSLGLSVVEIDRTTKLLPEDEEGEVADLRAALSERHPVQYRTFDNYMNDDA